jgi:branched-chain amino acid transport system ATP-binding protein
MGYQFTSGITFTGSLFKIKHWKKQYKQAYELVRFYLSMFSLEGIGNRLARELSFGQQKRLELIRAFVSPANFFWFDEPFAGLDSAVIGLTVDKIIKCVKEKDGILCLIDHRREIVNEISDNVFQFSYGNMIVVR